ncbi:O-methyltransferase involved in polyketide biosynthesis [Mesorhizobium soli]|uniref:class I SAM-dependent methyltransferase n=1 Tax=Pseudaminobacter soli (ex Li et al. 2025) TaxID=1295366 RepID=UPI0024734B0A|nr:class I SAM-dependent methyltransferase [Mesorhizobium soli]MDH6230695.1 O-methyltransferase involved in polyketide biosynthesis [Mesorhizobium soli]
MVREKVSLTRERETLLITLYGKALESRRPNSILADHFAEEAAARIDYDFSKLKVDGVMGVGFAARARTLDDWVRAFLADHPDAIVLDLGCGLDTRVFRIDPSPRVEWLDVDFPEVVELRRRIYPLRENYRLIATSVTEPDWLARVPRGRPAIVVAEGLTPYLAAKDGPLLLSRLVSHLSCGGEVICDLYSDLGLKLVRQNPAIRVTGAEVHWAVNDPHDLERAVPGLKLVEEASAYRPEHFSHMDWSNRWIALAWNIVPPLRKIGRLVRFRF